jgi:outer membrane protein OmpA-like peptidoglycan-associated protein
MRIPYSALIATTTLALLSACATNEPAPSSSVAAPTTTKNEAAAGPAQSTMKVTPVPFKEGTVAVFTKTGTTLEQADVDYLAQYASTFKKAKAIQVIGYCLRKDNVKGAQQVALARATAVRNELIKLGVAGSKVTLKFNTEEDRHSVSVMLD